MGEYLFFDSHPHACPSGSLRCSIESAGCETRASPSDSTPRNPQLDLRFSASLNGIFKINTEHQKQNRRQPCRCEFIRTGFVRMNSDLQKSKSSWLHHPVLTCLSPFPGFLIPSGSSGTALIRPRLPVLDDTKGDKKSKPVQHCRYEFIRTGFVGKGPIGRGVGLSLEGC